MFVYLCQNKNAHSLYNVFQGQQLHSHQLSQPRSQHFLLTPMHNYTQWALFFPLKSNDNNMHQLDRKSLSYCILATLHLEARKDMDVYN